MQRVPVYALGEGQHAAMVLGMTRYLCRSNCGHTDQMHGRCSGSRHCQTVTGERPTKQCQCPPLPVQDTLHQVDWLAAGGAACIQSIHWCCHVWMQAWMGPPTAEDCKRMVAFVKGCLSVTWAWGRMVVVLICWSVIWAYWACSVQCQLLLINTMHYIIATSTVLSLTTTKHVQYSANHSTT